MKKSEISRLSPLSRYLEKLTHRDAQSRLFLVIFATHKITFKLEETCENGSLLR